MLKAKIQQRPARHELEMRHILEAEPAVDPSLVEKQRMLKKARLADQLNDQLSHRPGPLELIQKNILHTEEPIEEAVKAGRIPFRATCEGQITKPQHPNSYVTYEDDSQSSEGDTLVSPGPVNAPDVLEAAAKSAGIVVSLAIPASKGTVVVTTATPIFKDNNDGGIVFADLCHTVTAPTLLPLTSVPSPGSLVSSTSTLSPLSSVASPVPAISQPITSAPATPLPVPLTPKPQSSPARSDAPGKDKNRKKSKSKSAPKTRTIKFHEYKGPPNAQKNSALSTGSPGETSYELLLKQQQLFLQWQLQLQHKYPQIILPAAQKPMSENSTPSSTPQQPQSTTITSDSIASLRLSSRLEDMKVSDLKAELKRRNLPVSGSKPQLIERLKPFTSNGGGGGGGDTASQSGHIAVDTSAPMSVCSEESQTDVPDEMTGSPHSVDEEIHKDTMEMCENINLLQQSQEDIVREQQKRIEELQRKLTLSQLQLQQVRAHPSATMVDHKAQRCIALQQHIQAKRQQHQMAMHVQQIQALQQLQAEQEQRQRLAQQQQQDQQQQQHVAFQNSKNLTNGLLLNTAGATIVLNQLMQGKVKLVNGQTRANSLPNFLSSVPVVPATVITAPEIQTTQSSAAGDVKPPPPLYEEATKQIKKENNNVKSQIVDDVLEILIKNGELPPSAAHDPSTPSSAGTRINEEPVFPPPVTTNEVNNTDTSLGLDAAVLQDFELDLDSLDKMDFSQLEMDLNMGGQSINQNEEYDNMNVPMDTDDSDWLDSLLPVEQPQQNISVAPVTQFDSEMSTYDPLLGNSDDPFDLFSLDDFKSPADLTSTLAWDKVDFAA